MGRRQKKLSNVSSSKAPVQFSQKGLHHQSKMVLLPCYPHQSMPSINEDFLSRAKLNQTKTKFLVNSRCKSTIISSSCHKEATTTLLPRIEHEAMLPHLETQVTIMPSPHSKHWGKGTVFTSPCHEYCATPLFGLNHWTEAPLIPEPLFKTSSGPDPLPKIPQGCHNRFEAQALKRWYTTPSFPDPNTSITAPYSQVKVATQALPCLSPQPSLSSRHWDWVTSSQFQCLNHQQKIEGMAFSCSDNYPKITTVLSSQSSQQVRPTAVSQECPSVPLAPMAMAVLTPIPNHHVRGPLRHDSDWPRTTSMPLQCPNTHLVDTPLIPHYNWVKGTFMPTKLPNKQPTFPPGFYNLAKVLLVSDQQVKSSVDLDHPAEILHLNYWVTPQPDSGQKTDILANQEHKSNFLVDQQSETQLDTCYQHEPIPGPDNETKKLLDPRHLETPEIHLNHSNEVSLDINCKETSSPAPTSQPGAASGSNDRDETISDWDHQDGIEGDLDHRTKGTVDCNHQHNASLDSSDWVQTAQGGSEHQVTSSLSLSQTAKSEEVPDHQDQPSPVSNQLEQTTLVSDHGTASSDSDHPPKAHLAAEHCNILRLNSDHQAGYKDTSPTDLEKHVPNSDNQHTLSPGSDHQASPLNLKDQVKSTLNPHCPAETVSLGLNPEAQESQRESLESFKNIHLIHATEGGATISKEYFNSIINSVPREKIKNDIQKQILLRRMRGHHNTQSGLHLSTCYPICLACNSWIPYGCLHVNGMKDPYAAQLMVLPSPMSTSKDEMGIKYVLQVPQSKTDIIWDSSCFTSSISSSCPHTMPLMHIDHQLPKRMTWLDFILAKDIQPHGRKISGNQQHFKGNMSVFSTPTERASRNEDAVRSLLDKLKNKRTAN
ncbi:uncharacterized protein [Notamacropus eugenii]|uniref:uncharacterized protein n=1 Tax=Notamacropus eugenii TaxID=9315 RepID=UPI003B66FD92